MSASSLSPAAVRGRLRSPRAPWASVAGLLLVGFIAAERTGAKEIQAIPEVLRGFLGGAILFAVTGAAAAARLAPAALRTVWPVLVLPAGAVLGSLALTALGFAAVPLDVSVWLVLAAGVAAWLRFARGRAPAVDWPALAPWVVAAALIFAIALIPAWRHGAVTIYGDNPDSHQVTGSAVLFQHAPAWATDVRLPVDVVPVNWRFRYPILYALAGASNLAHLDPIRVFPSMSGLMVLIAGLGFGALVVCCLRVPLGAGPWVAMAVPLNAVVLHVAWHPYYNQLWGIALLPWALLFGWVAVRERSRAAAAAFAGSAATLALAYSVAVLYPAVLVAALAWAHRLPRPRLPRPRGWRLALALGLGVLLFVPLLGAALKSLVALRQVLVPGVPLWGGDVHSFYAPNVYVGTHYTSAAYLAVIGVAAWAARRLLGRRELIAVGVLAAVCAAFAVRVRIDPSGEYMDFKHLTFVGVILVAFAAAGIVLMLRSPRRLVATGGVLLAALWLVSAYQRVREENGPTLEQVTAEMFELREWPALLPDGASIRIDVPASGVQLWAMYMLAEHPVSAPDPVLHTTYAHPPHGWKADYVLSPRHVPGQGDKPWPRTRYAVEPPVAENADFVLRKLVIPADLPDTSSRAMVQP